MASNNNDHCYFRKLTLPLLVLFTILTTGVHCVQITSVNIPSYFTLSNDDTSETLVLDCEYEIDDNETDLVVKWFKDGQAIYQWIESNGPKAFPKMRNVIDENYIISDHPRQRFRAVSFINPTTDLSGEYKCLVQTGTTVDFRISYLEVLDMTNITFKLDKIKGDDYTLLTCQVSNIKPKPTLELRLNKDEEIEINNEDVYNNTEGFFDVIVKGNISNDKIDSDSEFGCLLSFERTNYTKWHSELSSDTGTLNCRPLIGVSLISMFITFIVTTNTFTRYVYITF